MICEEALDLISAYQDGELSGEQRVQVGTHLKECVTCMAAYRANVVLSAHIRADAPTYAPSEALWQKLPQISRSGPRSMALAWGVPLGLAAVFLMLLLLTRRGGDTLTRELVADHVRSMMASHLFDVPSSDRHTVKPWFLGKLDFAPRVPDLKSSGYPLLGGRLDYVDGHAAAALVYGKQKHAINVLVLPAEGRSVTSAELDGYRVEAWKEGDLGYWAVSDVSADDLRAFGEAFRRTP